MPSWLKPIAEINPLTYSNAVIRGMLLGVQTNLIIDFTYLIIFTIVLSTVGIILSLKYISS